MAGDPKESELIIEQGRELRLWFRITVGGEVFDPPASDYNDAVLEVRDESISDGGISLYRLTVDNGGIVLGEVDDGTGTFWSGYIYGPASGGVTATDQLEPWGDAQWELVFIHDSNGPETVRRGVAHLIPMTAEV